MAQPEMQPAFESPKGRHGGRVPADDIELPPVPESLVGKKSAAIQTLGSAAFRPAKNSGGWKRVLGACGLAASLVLGGWLLTRGASSEDAHPNWQHVEAATEASLARGANLFVQVDSAGVPVVVPTMELSAMDAELDTSGAVPDPVRPSNDSGRDVRADLVGLPANAASPLAAAVAEEKTQFFQLRVFDCCDEDGDIVEISINGELLQTIPILHEGSLVVVPLAPGNNTLTLRGVQDGGGGITVAFQTSRGDFFCRAMKVGEEYHLKVAAR